MSNRHLVPSVPSSYYDVLGVSPLATDMDIKLAYRRLASYWHPDKQNHNPALCEENLKIINEAYSHLKTRSARSHYDHVLQLQRNINRFRSQSTQTHWGKFWNWLTMLESNNT